MESPRRRPSAAAKSPNTPALEGLSPVRRRLNCDDTPHDWMGAASRSTNVMDLVIVQRIVNGRSNTVDQFVKRY